MCLGIPMRVVECGDFSALCERDGQRRRLDMMRVGPQAPGTWVLAFMDHAREVLDPDEARRIDLAVRALESALLGKTDLDEYFPDLTGAAIHSTTDQEVDTK